MHYFLLKIKRMNLVLTISKVKEEICRVHEIESRDIPNGSEIVHDPIRMPAINRVPVRQNHHLIKHPIQPAGRLVDGGDYGPTRPGEPAEHGHNKLGRCGVQTRSWLIDEQQTRVD